MASRYADNTSDLIKFEDIPFNRNSAKIKRKLRRVLDWCAQFRHMSEFGHPATKIEKVFGSNATEPVSAALTKCFLLRTNSTYSDGKKGTPAYTCKYKLVASEIDKAHAYLLPNTINEAIAFIEEDNKKEDITPRTRKNVYVNNNSDKANHPFYKMLAMSEFQSLSDSDKERVINAVIKHYDALMGRKPFEYSDKSSRLWNGIQNISSDGKKCLFKAFGMPYDYDQEAAAATLIVEFCRHAGRIQVDEIPVVMEYIADRKSTRMYLCNNYGITYDQSKKVFASLVNRAPINPVFGTCGYSEIFSNDVEGYQAASKIAKDKVVRRFKQEMKHIWRCAMIEVNMAAWKSGNAVGQIGKGQNFMLYFKEERRMLDLTRNYLDRVGARYFLEHDGFRTDKEIDLSELLTYLKEQTGYEQIKISRN